MSNAKLTRLKNLLVKIQGSESPETLAASDAILIKQDGSANFGDVQMNDRLDLASNSLSNYGSVPGLKAARISATAELAGSGDLSVAPQIGTIFKAGSMSETGLVQLEVGAITGGDQKFNRGDIVETAGGAKTGRVVVPCSVASQDDWLTIEPLTGTFVATDAISTQATSVAATAAPVDVKRVQIGSIIGNVLRVGQTVTGSVSGNKVRVQREAKTGDAWLYYTEEVVGNDIALGDTLTVRNKSVLVKSASEDVVALPVDKATYAGNKIVAGQTVEGSVSAASGTVLENYAGEEAFLYVDVDAGAFDATDVIAVDAVATVVQSVEVGGWSYKPVSAGQQIVTAQLQEDGMAKTIYSSMSTLSFTLNPNSIGTVAFEMLGPIQEDATGDKVMDTVPYAEIKPPVMMDARMNLVDGGTAFAPVAREFSVDVGNALQIRLDANSPVGCKGSIITSRAPSATLTMEQVAEADYDVLGRFFAGRQAGFQAKLGEATGNTVWFFADHAQFSGLSTSDSSGIVTNQINLGLYRGEAGDDELEIVFI